MHPIVRFVLLSVGFGVLYCILVGVVSLVKNEGRVVHLKYAFLNGFLAAAAYLLIRNGL